MPTQSRRAARVLKVLPVNHSYRIMPMIVLGQDVTSLQVCLIGLAIDTVTASGSITRSQAYAGVDPESFQLGLNFSTFGRRQGDNSKFKQLHQDYMT